MSAREFTEDELAGSSEPSWPMPWPNEGTIRRVQRIVAAHFQIGVGDLLGTDRRKSTALARHVAIYLARRATVEAPSYPELARAFRRDHTSVMYAVAKMATLRARRPDVDASLWALEQKIAGAS